MEVTFVPFRKSVGIVALCVNLNKLIIKKS